MVKVQHSETLFVGAMLSLTAGFLNAYTYLVRGGVFASMQTGNMIFCGLHIAQGNGATVLMYLASIMSFAVGVFVTECIRSKLFTSKRIHWRQVVLILEIVVIACTVLIPVGDMNMLANCLISFVCAMQIDSFRKIDGKPSVTTMMTGSLRSAVQYLYEALVLHDRQARHNFGIFACVIVCFLGGVIASYFCVQWIAVYAVLWAIVPLVCACIGMINFPSNMHGVADSEGGAEGNK